MCYQIGQQLSISRYSPGSNQSSKAVLLVSSRTELMRAMMAVAYPQAPPGAASRKPPGLARLSSNPPPLAIQWEKSNLGKVQ
jgi:hypothetical protein